MPGGEKHELRLLKLCKTCSYWAALYPNQKDRTRRLNDSNARIKAFRAGFPEAIIWSEKVRQDVGPKMESLYKNCQKFAMDCIKETLHDFVSSQNLQQQKLANKGVPIIET